MQTAQSLTCTAELGLASAFPLLLAVFVSAAVYVAFSYSRPHKSESEQYIIL
jgi:hypothetical protein